MWTKILISEILLSTQDFISIRLSIQIIMDTQKCVIHTTWFSNLMHLMSKQVLLKQSATFNSSSRALRKSMWLLRLTFTNHNVTLPRPYDIFQLSCLSEFLTTCTIWWMAPCHCTWCSLHPMPSEHAYRILSLSGLTPCSSIWLLCNLKLLQKLFSMYELLEYFQFLSDNVSHGASLYVM